MSDIPGEKIFSLDEANACLPRVRVALARLRETRKRVVAAQAAVDIEEMTGGRGPESKDRIDALLKGIQSGAHDWHKELSALESLGCALKDLDKGLIDFFAMHGGELVCYCWMEGEESISHWHTLDAGFQGRKKIEE